MVHSILYVSQSLLTLPKGEAEVQAIVDWSRGWNETVGITGALVFTEQHFAQFIEGPAPAVLDLIAKIKRDHRHTHVDIIREKNATSRRFTGWSLAYSGPELFLEPQILPLAMRVPGSSVEKAAENLMSLMRAFTQPTT